MSSERVELVKRGYEAWNTGDRSWVLEHMSEDVEWVSPPEDPDPGTYRGYEGVEQFWSQWRAAVGQLEFKIEEITEQGDHVIVTARRSGRGEHSGLAVSDRVIQVFTFQGEKCVSVHEYYDRDAALRDFGIERVAEQ
ncbi:MAG: nuclear transport factor 2 family protein [Solirubrobacterales bacterium]